MASSLSVKRGMSTSLVAAKRPKTEGNNNDNNRFNQFLSSPIIQLTGHQGEVFACRFSPDGQTFASAGHDRQLFLWSFTEGGDVENVAALSGHKGAILDIAYLNSNSNNSNNTIVTASSDKSLAVWDSRTFTRVKRLKGHSAVVNSTSTTSSTSSSPLIVSGSDDSTIKIWDPRIPSREANVQSWQDKYQILATTFDESGRQVIFGGIENVLKVYDLRKGDCLLHDDWSMVGHFDSITGLSLSPDGGHVLSHSMDGTLCVWDVRPFVVGGGGGGRCVKTFHGSLQGNNNNFEKNLLRCSWSPDGSMVAAGSTDRHVYVWDVSSSRILYRLPGHSGTVNDVSFRPSSTTTTSTIIASASSDKTLFLGELSVDD